jgi:spore germination protein GerM
VRRARAALAAAALAVGLAACGIPADDEPRAIPEEQAPSRPDAGGGVPDQARTTTAQLYFTRYDGSRDNLVAVTAEVAAGSSGAPTPATVLEALLEGPDALDVDDNLVTRIPAGTALDGQPELHPGGVLRVHLTAAINGVQGDGARLAFGQMVCTLDSLEGVNSVLFAVDGEAVRAPTGQGENVSSPLSCNEYENLMEGEGPERSGTTAGARG